MPFTFNGIGTQLCGYAAPTAWSKPGLLGSIADHDAVECFVVMFLPIFPLKAVHTFNWSGNRYRVVPLRFRSRLVAQAYLRPWGVCLALIGAMMIFGSLPMYSSPSEKLAGIFLSFFGALLVTSGIAAFPLSQRIETRSRDIRLILGPHELGSSDPATWQIELLGKLPPHDLSNARAALDAWRPWDAMYQARLAAGRGDPQGDALTDEILAHPRVAGALPALRKEPWRRGEILTTAIAA